MAAGAAVPGHRTNQLLLKPLADALVGPESITAPTLIIAGRDDSTGWRPSDARVVAAGMRDARVVAAPGAGHSSPLIGDLETVERALEDFWEEVPIPYRP